MLIEEQQLKGMNKIMKKPNMPIAQGLEPTEDIKTSLKYSYNSQAEQRDAAQLDSWKIEERESVLCQFQANHVQNVLEIGAGPGRDSLFFSKHLDITAVDMSEEMVRLCRQKGLHAIVMDFYELRFGDQAYDAVYAMNCLLHVPKAQLTSVLAEIRRVLKPGGLFYMGLYGGFSKDGIWELDTYEPKRYFAMYPDEEIQGIVQEYFHVEDFHTRSMGEGQPHFQSMLLRKR